MLDLSRAGEVIAPGRTNEDEIKLLKTEGGSHLAPKGGEGAATPVLVKPPVSKAITDNPQPLT
jgi:hypothetical protein